MQLQLALTTFEYHKNQKIRTLGTQDNPLFVASDVCAALGLQNVSRALAGVDVDDITLSNVIDSIGRKQEVKCLTEAGLYQLIFKSEKAEAKEFKRWVTKEVLPQIRKTGAYSVAAAGTHSFVRRFNSNWSRIEGGYFSVISELYIRVHGRFEQLGCIIAERGPDGKEIRPDVSVGKLFSAHMKKNYPKELPRRKTYSHIFDDGTEVEAYQYPIDLLPIFIDYVETIWLKDHAVAYLEKRDTNALLYLPKILPALKPTVRIAAP